MTAGGQIDSVDPVASRADVARVEAAGFPPDLPPSTYDALARSAEMFGDAPALSFFLGADQCDRVERWSYRGLFAEVTRAANIMHGLGVTPDDVVAYLLPNLPETHFVLWGGEAAAIVVPINPLLEPDAIAALLTTARAKVLVTLAPFPGTDLHDKAMAAATRVPGLADLVLIDMADHVPGWKRIPARLMAWRAARASTKAPAGVKVHRYRTLAARAPSDHLLSARRIGPDAASSYFTTGGTTGLPKLAKRTHGAEVANAWMTSRMSGDAIGPGTVVFCGLPLFHVNAAMVTGLAAFMKGSHVLLGTPQGYRGPGVIDGFWRIVERHRVTVFSGVPTLYAALLQKPLGGHDISSLSYAYCGAAPMPTALIQRFEAATGVVILEGYGMTEGTCVSTVTPLAGRRQAGSVGLPIPFQDLRAVVLDADGAFVRDAAVDEPGVIAIAGPNLFSGYLAEAHNRGIWIDRGDGRRWFNTGDLGRVDAEGYVWLTGRAKDVIIRGGHNIDPAMIEDAMLRHPAVALVAAIGRPDAHAGEVPVTYVQLKAGVGAREEELLAFADAEIPERAARPKAVRVVDALPLTAIGKIFKPRLREWETKRLVEDTLAAAGLRCDVSVATREWRGLVVGVRAESADEAAVRAALAGFALPLDVEHRVLGK